MTDEINILDINWFFQDASASISITDIPINFRDDIRINTTMPYIPKITSIDFAHPDDFISKDLPIILEKMSRMGWSIPIWITFYSLKQIKELEYTSEDINNGFDLIYSRNENKKLKELIDFILSKQDATKWKQLIEECYESFVDGRYISIIPTLFTILEGYVSQVFAVDETTPEGRNNPINLGTGYYKKCYENPEIISYVNSLRNSNPSNFSEIFHKNKDRINAKVYSLKLANSKSIQLVIEGLYEKSNFASSPPDSLNRNWIMHGRQVAPNPKVNALQLFNLIGSISMCFEDLSQLYFSEPGSYLKYQSPLL